MPVPSGLNKIQLFNRRGNALDRGNIGISTPVREAVIDIIKEGAHALSTFGYFCLFAALATIIIRGWAISLDLKSTWDREHQGKEVKAPPGFNIPFAPRSSARNYDLNFGVRLSPELEALRKKSSQNWGYFALAFVFGSLLLLVARLTQ